MPRWNSVAAIGIPDAFGCFSTLRGSLGALGARIPPVDGALADDRSTVADVPVAARLERRLQR